MPGAATWKGPTTSLVEDVDSPTTTFGDGITRTRIYHGLYTLCAASVLGKGTIGTGDETGFRVKTCTFTRERGNIGRLEIVWEITDWSAGEGAPIPEPTFELQHRDIEVNINRHPLFAIVTSLEHQNIEAALNGADQLARDEAESFLFHQGSEDAIKLYELRQLGMEKWIVSSWMYSETHTSTTEPICTQGGYTEVLSSPLITLPPDASWLRMADDLSFRSGLYTLTKSWLGANKYSPDGGWNPYIYAPIE